MIRPRLSLHIGYTPRVLAAGLLLVFLGLIAANSLLTTSWEKLLFSVLLIAFLFLLLPPSWLTKLIGAPTHLSESKGRSRLEILFAEDQDLNRQMMRIIMAQFGHNLTLAENGTAAIELLRQRSFDLVLMDIHMPVMDGLAATRIIRAAGAPWSKTPIIAVTSQTDDASRRGCKAAGMDGFVSKPVRVDELAKEVKRVLGIALVSAQPIQQAEGQMEEQLDADAALAKLANELDHTQN